MDDEALTLEEYPRKEEIARWARTSCDGGAPCSLPAGVGSSSTASGRSGAFLRNLGLSELGILRVARVVYTQLGPNLVFHRGEDEVRGMDHQTGSDGEESRGKIHSDIERGFMWAEVVSYHDSD